MAASHWSGPIYSSGGFVGNVTGNVSGANTGASPVAVTASTLTATAATHAGRAVLLNRAAGITVTLPAASGSGAIFTFILQTAVTSNSTIIKVANSSDAFIGLAVVRSDDTANAIAFSAVAGTSDTVTLNGTTTGGLAGDVITVRDVAANVFHVLAHTQATGTEATPFSATV